MYLNTLLLILFVCACTCYQANFLQHIRRANACKPLKIPNGRVRVRSRSIFAQFTCNKGFLLAGERYIKCVKGEWSGTPPKCVRNTCNKPQPPRNGFMFGAFRGAVLNFFCLPGYEVHGMARVFCDGSSWNAPLPACLATNATPSLTCDFETEDMCGWTHDLNHDFDWTRSNNTDLVPVSPVTGPQYDHTLGADGKGHYMYIEASTREENDTSRLISPVYLINPHAITDTTDPSANIDGLMSKFGQSLDETEEPSDSAASPRTASGYLCLELYYHMYGDSTQQLRVYVSATSAKWGDLVPQRALLWKRGNHGDVWHKAVLTVGVMTEAFQIIIEGVRGDNFASNMAVDDVKIIEDCPYNDETLTTDRDFTETETIQIESCLNRCYTDNYLHGTKLLWCDCDENCVLNNTCCPDFTAICILGNTEIYGTEAITPESMQATEETVTNEENNELDNDIVPIIIKPPIKKATTNTTEIPTTTIAIKLDTTKPETTVKLTSQAVTITTVKTTSKPAIAIKLTPTTTTIPPTVKTTKPDTRITHTKPTISDISRLPNRPDVLITSIPNDVDVFHTTNEQHKPKSARITVKNTTSDSTAPHLLVILSVVGFALVGIVTIAVLVKKYATQKCRHLATARMRDRSHGDSQSDVRFLTSDEILDFTVAKPDDYHTI